VGSDPEENSLEDAIVRLALSGELAKAAGDAIRKAKRLGLPVTYLRGNQVVKEYADGRIEVIETLAPPAPYALPRGVKIFSER